MYIYIVYVYICIYIYINTAKDSRTHGSLHRMVHVQAGAIPIQECAEHARAAGEATENPKSTLRLVDFMVFIVV